MLLAVVSRAFAIRLLVLIVIWPVKYYCVVSAGNINTQQRDITYQHDSYPGAQPDTLLPDQHGNTFAS